MQHCSHLIVGLTVLATLVGCGDDGPDYIEVSGQLTVDQKGVDGTGFALRFDGGRTGVVLDLDASGKFSGKVEKGENQIYIVQAGGGHGGGTVDVSKLTSQGVPAHYIAGRLRQQPNQPTPSEERITIEIPADNDNLVINIQKQ